jgi:hypothetical protein
MSRDRIVKEVDEIIIEILSSDGDVFIDDKVRDYREKGKLYSTNELNELYKHVLYIKDQIQFAALFQAFIVGLIKLFKPDKAELLKRKISDQFISKNQHFITQLWYWIVYYQMWYFIKFIAGIFVAIISESG